MSTDIKLSKAQISKMIQSGLLLGTLLSKIAGLLMKVAVPIAKNILAPLGITAAASAIDAGIQKQIHGSGTTTLIISNEEMNGIMKIVQAKENARVKDALANPAGNPITLVKEIILIPPDVADKTIKVLSI